MAGVTSSYPAALDSESNLTPPNNGDTLSVADHWLAGNSGPIVAIETELGTDPAGTFTDVKSRLDDVDDKVITEIDSWHISTFVAGTAGTFTSNWVRTPTLFSAKGAGLSESSGIFSFPSTGYYKIIFRARMVVTGGSAQYAGALIKYTTDDFSSVDSTYASGYNNSYTASSQSNVSLNAILKISDIANQKIKFNYESQASTTYSGDASVPLTGFTSVKIGELS